MPLVIVGLTAHDSPSAHLLGVQQILPPSEISQGLMQVEKAANPGSCLIVVGQKWWIPRQSMAEGCLHMCVQL